MVKVPWKARRACSSLAALHSPPAAWIPILIVALGCSSDPQRPGFVETQADWTPAALVSTERPTALLFWAPWCEECVELMPAFDRLAEQRGKTAAMAAVCIVEAGDDLAALDLTEAAHVAHYAWKRPLSAALEEIGAAGLPALLVFDSQGRPLHRIASSDLDGDLGIPDMTDALDAVTP